MKMNMMTLIIMVMINNELMMIMVMIILIMRIMMRIMTMTIMTMEIMMMTNYDNYDEDQSHLYGG